MTFTLWRWPDGRLELLPRGVPFPSLNPLFNLDRLSALPDATVVLVEGEKTATKAQQIFPEPSYVVTTSTLGAKSASRSDWSPLTGRRVIIVPDADADGDDYAGDVTARLNTSIIKLVDARRLAAINPLAPDGPARPVYDHWDLADAVEKDPAKAGRGGIYFVPEPWGDLIALQKAVVACAEDVIAHPILTEDSCALRFAAKFRDRLKYDHDSGKWFVWDGNLWRPNNTSLAFQHAREVVRSIAVAEKDRVRFIASKTAFAAGVERFAKADTCFAVTSDYWNRNLWLFGTPGGTVDLRTGVLHEASPSDAISKSASVKPADTADCPLFRKFLKETFSDDDNLIRFVQQFLGYALTGVTTEQIFSFGYGDGGNGKGVLVNTIKEIFGDYCVQATMESLTASRHPQHTTDIAMLAGARLVTASETERGRHWAEKTVCNLTGGDPVQARFMRKDNVEFIPQLKLFIIGNHKPSLVSVTEAMRRRLKMIPFLNKPKKPDLGLKDKLKNEHPAILRWLIEGCLDWQKNGFVACAAISDATKDYFQEQDLFAQWIEEDCELRRDKKEPSAKLFASWKAFLLRNSQGTDDWNSTNFGIELRKYAEKGTGRMASWVGIGFKPPIYQGPGSSAGSEPEPYPF